MARALQSLGDYEDLAFVTAPKCSALIIGCTAGTGAPFRNLEEVSLSIPLGFDPSTISLSYTGSEGLRRQPLQAGDAVIQPPFLLGPQHDFSQRLQRFRAQKQLRRLCEPHFFLGQVHRFRHRRGRQQRQWQQQQLRGGRFIFPCARFGARQLRLLVDGLGKARACNSASAAYRAPAFVASESVTEAGKTTQATGQLDGSIAILNGVHFANRIDNTFAVVDTGIPDARVLYQNNPIGETGPDGTLLIASLRAHEYNTITIDPASLPLRLICPKPSR